MILGQYVLIKIVIMWKYDLVVICLRKQDV